MRQEFFTASRGDGAQLEGKKIRVSTQRTLEGALIGTGFPFRAGATMSMTISPCSRWSCPRAAGVRRPGAASLDLAYVAAGRIDGFWEFGLSPWDTAAGTLLIQEAGGRVGTPSGAEYALGPECHRRQPEGLRGAARGARAAHAGCPARLSAARGCLGPRSWVPCGPRRRLCL